ncbi:HNH endonuclease [Streptomyces anulatus]|uniref:HNH endonuclease n=1 Tax=Streptomyces anulatus TaxID=1892 RepID=UPI0022579B39|nr:HNH endonuclease [Streptomyces anulatus]MCX4506624.1 HNH endonuclease [Streptomyces anulatus]WTD23057.1 HNH endonuclease [Streptomyces anulatus]
MVSQPRRSYSNATIAALTTLARGGCYYPGCNVPILRLIDGEPFLNLEIAHIRAFEDNGPRSEEGLDIRGRNSFGNLILLCTPHHKLVDGPRSAEFPVETLDSWKEARESEGIDALAGLTDLTEDKLASMIQEAQYELFERLEPALDEFARTAPELAALLRSVTREISDPRIHGFGMPEDGIRMLSSASRDLTHLQDTAPQLVKAAQFLAQLPDVAKMLNRAAANLSKAAAQAQDAAAVSRNSRR